MSQLEILIVDDDEGVVRALVARLEHAGYTCKTASSGAQALSLFNRDRVGLVITDINMPNGDGVSLIRSIRDKAATPIVAISGFSKKYEQTLADFPGVTLFQKPFDSASLIDLVEVELNSSPMNDAA